MTGRTPVPEVTAALRPVSARIDALLKELHASVAVNQQRRQLAATIRDWRAAELEIDNDLARGAAAAYTRVLVEMGAWGE